MLAIMLVFGMMVISCDEDFDENALDMFNFKTTDPSAAALAAGGGITLTQFNQIKDAAGGGYLGWDIDMDEDLAMAWSGRSLSNFTAVANVLNNLFDEEWRGIEDGIHAAEGENYILFFYPSRFSEGGYFVPAGTMIAFFW